VRKRLLFAIGLCVAVTTASLVATTTANATVGVHDFNCRSDRHSARVIVTYDANASNHTVKITKVAVQSVTANGIRGQAPLRVVSVTLASSGDASVTKGSNYDYFYAPKHYLFTKVWSTKKSDPVRVLVHITPRGGFPAIQCLPRSYYA
jgi:hypothetical protein